MDFNRCVTEIKSKQQSLSQQSRGIRCLPGDYASRLNESVLVLPAYRLLFKTRGISHRRVNSAACHTKRLGGFSQDAFAPRGHLIASVFSTFVLLCFFTERSRQRDFILHIPARAPNHSCAGRLRDPIKSFIKIPPSENLHLSRCTINPRWEKKERKKKTCCTSLRPCRLATCSLERGPCSPLVPRPPGVPGLQRVGPVRHQVHAERDLQPAAVAAEVAAVRHGRRGGGEQPFPVSTSPPHSAPAAPSLLLTRV